MAWQDRIKQAVFESPSGIRLPFAYENIQQDFEKLGTAFNYPDAQATFVQSTGRTGRNHPFRVFFWGDDYDLQAEAFVAAISEPGIGRLEHPLYGVFDVVPLGQVRWRDNLKTAANQSIFEVTFWETISGLYPSVQKEPARSVVSAVDEYNQDAPDAFANKFAFVDFVQSVGIKNKFRNGLQSIRTITQAAALPGDELTREFEGIYNSINASIDALVTVPSLYDNMGDLASQAVLLIQTPASGASGTGGGNQLNYYTDVVNDVIGTDYASDVTLDSVSNFQIDSLFAETALTGMALSLVNARFDTKPQAIQAAADFSELFDSVASWRDNAFEAFSDNGVDLDSFNLIIDTGEAYQDLHGIVSLTAGFLVEISFTLKQERVFELQSARSIIDLVAELYGRVDEELDFFIESNRLTGDEILELPKGREIAYYV